RARLRRRTRGRRRSGHRPGVGGPRGRRRPRGRGGGPTRGPRPAAVGTRRSRRRGPRRDRRPPRPGRGPGGRTLDVRLPVALALVAVGGSAGTAARVVVSTLFPGQPLASTLAVNAAGAFALGLLVEVLDARRDTGRRHGARLVLGAGFCGGFTTYSLIAYQVADLTRGGDLHTAVTYGLATLVLGGVAAAGGMLLGITVRGSGHGRSRTCTRSGGTRWRSGGSRSAAVWARRCGTRSTGRCPRVGGPGSRWGRSWSISPARCSWAWCSGWSPAVGRSP